MSTSSVRSVRKIVFGEFELDTRAGELRRGGRVVRLQEQTLRLLMLLLERRGEVASREEIRRRLWPHDTVVEVSHGINAAVQRLREALEETAEDPRHIETVARRGYRFRGEASARASDPVGRTVGRFRVLEQLGAGGMGLVYRAEDLRLGREVALKLLPPKAARDRTAILRFEREARAASALNHPHICTIYGVEDYDGQPAIVMEYVAGPSLEAKLREGPMPEASVRMCVRQIAGALEAAHRKGVVHRDLKPGNIVIGEGGVKVLDFGLAKNERDGPVTKDGAVVGTPDYMSPEQLRGEDVDARSDLYSFGVVLREMAPAMSGRLGEIARRCLQTRPEDRFQSAGQILAEFEEAERPRARWGRREWIGAAAIGSVAMWTGAASVLGRKERRWELRHPGGEMTRLSLSPDGRQLAYNAGGRLFVRRLDGSETRMIEGARGVGTAFWSPSGQMLGMAAGGKLSTIDLRSGAVWTLADVNTNIGGCWGADGSIWIGVIGDGLFRIEKGGGALRRVTTVDSGRDETRHILPQFLPAGQRYLFTAGASKPGGSMLWVGSVGSEKRVAVRTVETGAVYVPGRRGAALGHLFFGRQRSLVALPFDAERLAARGPEMVLAEGVVTRAAVGSAVQLLEFSAAGDTVAYRLAGREETVVVRDWAAARG